MKSYSNSPWESSISFDIFLRISVTVQRCLSLGLILLSILFLSICTGNSEDN